MGFLNKLFNKKEEPISTNAFSFFKITQSKENVSISCAWEQLKVYHSLDKKNINPTFKKFGNIFKTKLNGYSVEQTGSMLKISKICNELEQAIFIEKSLGNSLEVIICLKPVDFYKPHKFTMIFPVALGDILNNHRRNYFPLTKEWEILADYLMERINNEIEDHFEKYNSYRKIIQNRAEIEPEEKRILSNRYELLIYAAIKTQNKDLLERYLDYKIKNSAMRISKSEFLKPHPKEINEEEFLNSISNLVKENDFKKIEKLLIDLRQ